MPQWTHFYLLRLEFLGFRYSGWQTQPGQRTVQGMVDKTVAFVLGEQPFRTLGASRTDAKVSARDFVCELFLTTALPDDFFAVFNQNLPPDIVLTQLSETHSAFNLIGSTIEKEYHYRFAQMDRVSPEVSPFVTAFGADLDLQKMKEAASRFQGEHNFRRFTSKPSEQTQLIRSVKLATIEQCEHPVVRLPEAAQFVFKVTATGFLRYQVRLMMGALVLVGKGKWSVADVETALKNPEGPQVEKIAPGSALCLMRTLLDDSAN